MVWQKKYSFRANILKYHIEMRMRSRVPYSHPRKMINKTRPNTPFKKQSSSHFHRTSLHFLSIVGLAKQWLMMTIGRHISALLIFYGQYLAVNERA